MTQNDRPLLQISYYWNFRHRFLRYYWYRKQLSTSTCFMITISKTSNSKVLACRHTGRVSDATGIELCRLHIAQKPPNVWQNQMILVNHNLIAPWSRVILRGWPYHKYIFILHMVNHCLGCCHLTSPDIFTPKGGDFPLFVFPAVKVVCSLPFLTVKGKQWQNTCIWFNLCLMTNTGETRHLQKLAWDSEQKVW